MHALLKPPETQRIVTRKPVDQCIRDLRFVTIPVHSYKVNGGFPRFRPTFLGLVSPTYVNLRRFNPLPRRDSFQPFVDGYFVPTRYGSEFVFTVGVASGVRQLANVLIFIAPIFAIAGLVGGSFAIASIGIKAIPILVAPLVIALASLALIVASRGREPEAQHLSTLVHEILAR